jgi:hypothetical protein
MMLIDNKFELEIPTHIKFTLYKFDYIDSIIIARVLKECKNWNIDGNDVYTFKTNSFKAALLKNRRLKTEINKVKGSGLVSSPDHKPNTITFLWAILDKLPNVEWLSFNISYDKTFTRLIKLEKQKVLNFYFKIEEGKFDLTRIFNRESLDIINKKIIQFGLMPNKYLERSPYFYMQASFLFNILEELEMDGELETFELLDSIDPKLEEDDPMLLVITDYTSY